jgi:hypothetical protein
MVMLFLTSWVETYPPGPSAELTGAIVAPLTGAIITAIGTSTRNSGASVAYLPEALELLIPNALV